MCEHTRVVRKEIFDPDEVSSLSRRRLDSATSHLRERFVVSNREVLTWAFIIAHQTCIIFFYLFTSQKHDHMWARFSFFFSFRHTFSVFLFFFTKKMILLINKGSQNAIRFFTCFQMCSMLVVLAYSSLAITCRAMLVLMLLLTTQLWSNNWIKTLFSLRTLSHWEGFRICWILTRNRANRGCTPM